MGAGRGEDKEVRQRGEEQGQLCDQGVIWTPLHSCHSESVHNEGAGGGGSVVGSVAAPRTCSGNVSALGKTLRSGLSVGVVKCSCCSCWRMWLNLSGADRGFAL